MVPVSFGGGRQVRLCRCVLQLRVVVRGGGTVWHAAPAGVGPKGLEAK